MGLNWKGQADIREIYIEDHRKDTLIYVKRLNTSLLSVRNLINGRLEFGTVSLEQPHLYITTYQGEDIHNFDRFLEKFESEEPDEETGEFILNADRINLSEGKFRVLDHNEEDPMQVAFDPLNLDAFDFAIVDSDISARIAHLSLRADRGYAITDLQGQYCYNPSEMSLTGMDLQTDHSSVKGDLIMNYAAAGMTDFNNNVQLSADLWDSRVGTDDINTFYNGFGSGIDILVTGELNGTLNDFSFRKVDLSLLNSRISGNFYFNDLLAEDRPNDIRAQQHQVRSNYRDLVTFMPDILGTSLPRELNELGYFTLSGYTDLKGEKLTTNSQLRSLLGNANIDLEIDDVVDTDHSPYRGQVELEAFNLGPTVGYPELSSVTADVSVDGSGFSRETVNTLVEGRIDSLRFKGYNYTNINLDGKFKNPQFNGNLSIRDPNLKMDFSGLVDISADQNRYDFRANVDYMELHQLKLVERDSIAVFSGLVEMQVVGTSEDDVQGSIEFKETFYQNELDNYFFDDFKVTASRSGSKRTIEVDSPDIIDGKVSGEFDLFDVPNLFRNAIGSIYTNYQPQEVTQDQYLTYSFVVYNKILEVFVPGIELGENTRVSGSVSSDEKKFKLNFDSPEILLFDNYLNEVTLRVDNDNPLYNTYISVDSIDAGFYRLNDLSLINATLRDTLYIQSEFRGGDQQEDGFQLSLYHTINPEGKSVVGMKRSTIEYKQNQWLLNKDNNKQNKIVFDDNFQNIKIDSLVLNHRQEYITMAGVLNGSNNKDIDLRFIDVNIDNITPVIDSLELDGAVNGTLRLLQQQGAYLPTADVQVKDLRINRVDFGDLSINVAGNEDLSFYSIQSELANEQFTSFQADGTVNAAGRVPVIDLDVRLNDFNLQAVDPFGAEVFRDIRGLASGTAKVYGPYDSPQMDGQFYLEEAGMGIPYLNLDFDLQEHTSVTLQGEEIRINPTRLTDTKYGTEAVLGGKITHRAFGQWKSDLDIRTDRLLVLDTPPDEDELYYGTAFISGEAQIKGPFDELVIDALATTEEGTSFKIPISDAESIGDDSFIHFISPEEKKALITGEKLVNQEFKGLTLNFDLDINENAEVEILVDQTNNSTLKGRGVGTLLIRINTLGRFDMYGDFLVIDGTYDFRYKTLIQKQFEVLPGGNITWDGSPTGAQLNLSAKYSTRANPSVLLDNPTANRKIPVEVVIGLTGEILQPGLDFDINFPDASSTLKSELEYKLQNDEERESQALFLIATNSFRGDTGAFANASGALVTESVNAIVADIFASDDAVFQVIPYYETGSRTINQETADQFGVELSTQISERILINGKVGIPVGGVTDNQVAGDIEIQWLVNEDGSMRMSFFNRQADIQFIGEDQIFEQGAGVSYSVDFDTFRELVEKLFNKKITLESEVNEQNNVVPDDNSYPVNFSDKKDNN
jgi:hypothetical protein